MIRISTAEFLGLFFEAMLYGIYFVTFVLFLVARTPKSHPRCSRLPWMITAVTLVLFVISTLHVALGLARGLDPGFCANTPPRGNLPRDWLTILRVILGFVQLLIADGALIYRCWIIYCKSWPIIAFPIILWAADLPSVVAYACIHASPKIPTSRAFKLAGAMSLVVWSLTITINIYATAMIVSRIWLVDKRMAVYPAQSSSGKAIHLRFIGRIIIESALLYTSTTIFAFVAFVLGNNLGYIATNINIQALGIAFNLILIRVDPHKRDDVPTRKPRTDTSESSPMKLVHHCDTTDMQIPDQVHVELSALNDDDGVSCKP